jgi:WhiB family redox-sensing transcriptional regulator
MRGEDWHYRAECLGEEPELFFPVGNKTRHAILQIREAKAVCRRCPVREECLNEALNNKIDHGVWGGLDEEERREYKRRLARWAVRSTI